MAAFMLTLTVAPSRAQNITAAPDGTGTAIVHNGNTYIINGGTQAGANLFHSFQEFGLSPQETAHFLSNPSIRNVLGRVVGGNASTIEGLIRLSGGNSNLYLMNPAGIVFTQGARLDLPGSFAATTATRMGFEDGFFHAAGENDYAALTGNPTHFVFDTPTGSILNQGTLEVAAGKNLWLVGSSVLNTGTLKAPGGNVTIAAIPGQHQIRISQDNMLLNLVVEAVPMDEAEGTGQGAGTGPAEGTDPIGLQPIGLQATDLPRYLTGGSELDNANAVTIAADGTVHLSSNGNLREFQTGDVGIAGKIEADTVQLMAAGQVTPTDPALIQGDTTVVRFPGETDALSYNFIDGLIDDPTLFLYGGEQGSISRLVSSQENGIDVITARLADLAQQGVQLDGLRIVSEGGEGNFWLGNAWVTAETIQDYAGQLSTWSSALTASADILLYSCLTALGESGEALVSRLAEATGADVAASTNLTGSAALGGDWVLERQTGSIELGSGFEPTVLENFAGTLQVFTATDAASLIAAITTANGNAQADTINLAGDITLTAIDNPANGANGLPSIVADGGNKLTINGMGNTISRDATAPGFRLLHISLGGELEVNETTLSGGIANAGGFFGPGNNGGGVFNRGTVTLNNSTVSGNEAVADGGGVYSFGNITNGAVATITHSLITGNTAGGSGGGISNAAFTGGPTNTPDAATMTISNSLITGNSANSGGGISNFGQNTDNGAVMFVRNSTITGNSADFAGGGLYNRGQSASQGATLTITNSTVIQNTVPTVGGQSGGVHNTGVFGGPNTGRLIVGNSIIAQNTADVTPDVGHDIPFASSPVVDQGNNLIGIDSQGLFTTSTLVGSTAAPLDPQLLPLGDYGGPTQTYAVLPDSPAFNAGSNALATGLMTDQRGANRLNGTVDIGAFEFQGYRLVAIAGNDQNTPVNTNFGTNLAVQLAESFVNTPLPVAGLNVTFTANPGSTGASGSFASASATTNAAGIATAGVLTASADGGDFTVTASAMGVTDGLFNLTNTGATVDETVIEKKVVTFATPIEGIDMSTRDFTQEPHDSLTAACQTIPAVTLGGVGDGNEREQGSRNSQNEGSGGC